MKNDGRFVGISHEQIEETTARTGRQYLVGNLKRPQELAHVPDSEIEIGITRYESGGSELPHWHPLQHEYQYVIEGHTTYRNSITGETFEYSAGDFYAILPEICYSQQSSPHTTILFIKHPAVDDKMTCRFCRRPACPSRLAPFTGDKVVPE